MVKRILACGLSVVMFFSQSGITFAGSDLSGVQKEETFSDEEYAQATDEELSQLVHYGDVQSNDANQIENNGLVENNAVSNETAFASDLKNPVHHCDTSNNGANDYSDYSYIYFGSYPQEEVTDRLLINQIDKKLSSEGNNTGDVWIGNIKYRKIQKNDTDYDEYFNENSDEIYRYFKWERIKWKVLSIDNGEALVISVKGLDCQEFFEGAYRKETWETSSIRNWLNGNSEYNELDRNEGKSFTSTCFYKTAFSKNEQEIILNKTISNDDNEIFGTKGGNDTNDKIFLLSLAEVSNTVYGFCENIWNSSSTRWMEMTDYSHVMGADKWGSVDVTNGQENVMWWLRSPGDSSQVSVVDYRGDVNKRGYNYNSTNAIVPALYLNINLGEWILADDGTSGSGGSGGDNTGGNNNPSTPSTVAITSGDINGKGNAYVRFILKNSQNKILANTAVKYQYEGDTTVKTVVSNENGTITIPTKTYENRTSKQKQETCTINLTPFDTSTVLERNQIVVTVNVNPVSYTEKLNGKAGASASAGLAAGATVKVGPVQAGAVAEAGGGAEINSGLEGSIESDGKTGKKKLELSETIGGELTTDANASAGISWGKDAKENIQKKGELDFTIAGIGAGTSLGAAYEQGIVIEDCNNLSAEDYRKMVLLYGNLLTNIYPASGFLLKLNKLMQEDDIYLKNAYEVEASLKANGEALNFSVKDVDVKLAGIGVNYLNSYKSAKEQKEQSYTVKMVGETDFSLFDVGLKTKLAKEDKSKLKLTEIPVTIKNNVSITAKKDTEKNQPKSISVKYAITEDNGFSFASLSNTKYQKQTATGEYLNKLLLRNRNLDNLMNGRFWMPAPNDLSDAGLQFLDADIITDVENSEEDKQAFSFPLSVSAGVGAGGKLGMNLSGSHAKSYTTGTEKQYKADDKFSSDYVIGTLSTPLNLIQAEENQFKVVLQKAASQFGEVMWDYIKAAAGKVSEGVKNGWAEIVKNITSKKNREVSILALNQSSKKTVNNQTIPTYSVDFKNLNAQLLGAASLKQGEAEMVGESYMVLVEENGTAVPDFSDEPLKFRIYYDASLLNEAGASAEQAADIHMYRYDEAKDSYECLNGTLNQKDMYVETEIKLSGEYVLGIDYAAPIVSDLKVSDRSGTPLITAGIYDVSGIASITMYLDNTLVVWDGNMSQYVSGHALSYQVSEGSRLSVGKHRVSLSVSDTTGNSMSSPEILEFEVEYAGNQNAAAISTSDANTDKSADMSLKKPALSKLKKGVKSFKAAWKKVSGIDGYELQYSLKKNFKSAKTKKLSAKKTSVIVKKLKANKKYYVRMRTYKMVNDEKKYSGWSKVKAVKVK